MRGTATGRVRQHWEVSELDDTWAARAVYEATVPDYVRLIGTTISSVTETVADRRLLLDLIRGAAGARPIADLGSGPGRVAALCQQEGRQAVAVDMTLAMLQQGRSTHGDVGFVAAYLSALPFAPHTFGAAVLWYSIIHTAPAQLEGVFVEVHRIVAPDSRVLVAFQAGGGELHERADAYGTGITATSWRHDAALVRTVLSSSGFEACELIVREPELPHESAEQAFLLASARPVGGWAR